MNFRFTSRDIRYCADITEAKVMVLSEEFTERVEAIRSQLPTIKNYIFVGQNLPRYKRPHRIFFDKVPRNPTGKIEKPKLRQKYAA